MMVYVVVERLTGIFVAVFSTHQLAVDYVQKSKRKYGIRFVTVDTEQ